MNALLKTILDWIQMLVGSYGLSIVLFTILVRLVLMPLDYKSRVGMRKMQKLAPKQAELQKKYAKDQEKLQRKLGELYRQERVSPMSSCWPLLVSMPILFAMFGAMRMMADEQMAAQVFNIVLSGDPQPEKFLWVQNLWMPDSPFETIWPSETMLTMSTFTADRWQTAFLALSQTAQMELVNLLNTSLSAVEGTSLDLLKVLGDQIAVGSLTPETAETLAASLFSEGNFAAVRTALLELMKSAEGYAPAMEKTAISINLLITQLTVVREWNGLFLLPILSAVSQFVTTQLSSSSQPQPTGENQQQNGTNAFMKWFFPLFSLWICAGYNAAFALYWVTSNLIAMAQNFGINKYLDIKEAKAAKA